VSYYWDFGDGTTGSGNIAKHTYSAEGSYRIILQVADELGRTDSASSAVYIKPSRIYLNATVDPIKERYELGDVISGINVAISHSGGEAVNGASVSGFLSGRYVLPLVFREAGNGKYRADLNYPLMNGEKEFVNITIEAKDPSGMTGRIAKKLILLPKETEMMLNVYKPLNMLFAYGQKVDFEVRFLRSDTSEVMQTGDLMLYEGWTDREFSFRREGKDYFLTYEIPGDATNPISFIIYGNGFLAGKNYQAAREIRFDLTHDLKGEVISPSSGTYASDVNEIKLKVVYPDGSNLPDDRLKVYIGNESIFFHRSGDLYTGNYTTAGNEPDIDLWVFDSLGNGAGAKVLLATTRPAAEGIGATGQQIIYALLPIIAFLMILFLTYRFIEGRRRERLSLMKEYEETRQKIESLKAVTNNVMSEYYTRKITEKEARKRVLDCEKELVIERHRLKDVMEKLGMKPEDTQGEGGQKESNQKTEGGEDLNEIKEQVEDSNSDSSVLGKANNYEKKESG